MFLRLPNSLYVAAGVLCSRFPSARSLRLLRIADATRSVSSFTRHRMSLRVTSPTRSVSSVPRDHLITRSRGHVFHIRCGSLCQLRRIECGMLSHRHTCRVRFGCLRGAWWTFVSYRAILSPALSLSFFRNYMRVSIKTSVFLLQNRDLLTINGLIFAHVKYFL